MARIEAPIKHPGNVTGVGGLVFADGVAETDNPAIIGYCQSAGYTVDGTRQGVDDETTVDARDVADGRVGTALRDAAVAPEPEDFLAPINAGQADPHGPSVVAPEIHASGPKGIRPGAVAVDDLGKQEARETAYAEVRLIERADAADAVATVVPDLDDRGELGLSDPGSVGAEGDAADESEEAETGDESDEVDTPEAQRPGRNDAKAEWVDYAVTQGMSHDDAEAATKADLVARFGG